MLIICDIEGGEKDLFNETAVRKLGNADLIVELHGFLDNSIKPKLTALFEPTHQVQIIKEGNKNIFKYTSLEMLPLKTCYEFTNEDRPCEMEWLVARTKLKQS
jgi:hypothetical protein